MKYYKVKPQYDGYYKNPRIHNDGVYIGNEIYTLKEISHQCLNMDYMEEKEILYKDTYRCFGARFEKGTGYSNL